MKNNIYPDGALIMAPLSGFTDYPFRHMMRRFGCKYAFTEMIDAAALVYARKRTHKMLFRGTDEAFLGVQLVGRALKHLEIAAGVLNEYEFDVLDFNLGCPVPKVAKKGAGAVLGRDIAAAAECFRVLSENSRFPLTAKIRIADENDAAPVLDLCFRLRDLGARAITVHGRVKEKFYSGPVAYGQIETIREKLDIQIIGNGGVFDAASCSEMREKTGCGAVMIARGALGNPWIFAGFAVPEKPEVLDIMRQHVTHMVGYYGEESGMKIARKIVHDYLKGRGFSGEWRSGASFLKTLGELEEFIGNATLSLL